MSTDKGKCVARLPVAALEAAFEFRAPHLIGTGDLDQG